MRILVAGGAGFIGSWLCEALLEQGHEVTCVDNLFTGSKKNVHHLLSNPRFTFMQWDITVPFKFEADQVYNLACPASPIDYRYDGVETTKISVLGTINLAEQALRCGARYLFSSTSEVYGDPTVNPQTEDYWGNVNPIGPRSCYDEGKRCAESLLFDYERQYKLSIRVARIFNTYGPRTSPEDGRVVSNFVVQCLSGKPITIHGDGSQTRSFCYVEDTVRALIALMNLDHNPGPVNIGTPKEMPILELAQLIKTLTGSQSDLSYGPRPIDDPELRRPNIDKAKRLLNWEPNYSLENGLLNTIAYFRGEL